MTQPKRVDLLLKEIQDPHAQENFHRLKLYLENLKSSTGAGSGSVGPAGPPGPTGPAGTAGVSYLHSQSGAASTWIVNHNLGFKPNTSVYSVGGTFINLKLHQVTDIRYGFSKACGIFIVFRFITF